MDSKIEPKKYLYFDYIGEVKPWLIDTYPQYEQNIIEELDSEIMDMFLITGVGDQENGFVVIDLDIFRYNFSDWFEIICGDLKKMNDDNPDITLYITAK